MRLVKVDNLSWLVGLQWYVPPIDASVAEIKAYVEAENGDCIIRRGIQIGFGSTEGNSDLTKARSLAAWISIPVNSFVGIFSLADELTDEPFYWLFARVNGNNMSGFGDAIFETLEEAEKAREELLDLLPPDTEVEESVVCQTERESLAWLKPRCEVNLWARISGESLVKPLASFRGQRTDLGKRLVWAAAALTVLGFAAYYGHEVLTDMGMTAKAREKQAELQRQRREMEAHPEKMFVQKWMTYPRAGGAAMRCVSDAAALKINYAGWQLGSVLCAMGDKSGTITTEYSHTPLAAYRFIPPDATFGGKSDKGGKGGKGGEIKSFQLKKPLEWDLPPMNSPFYKDLPQQKFVQRTFLEIAQSFGIKTVVSFSPPEKKTIKELGTFTCPWTKGTFTLQAVNSIKIGGICDILNEIPALFITRIEYELAANKWIIRGDVYAMAPAGGAKK